MQGILLINLGSPKELQLKSVRSYLKEFLSDDLVIDIPKIFQQLLLNLIILPFRPKKTLEAYSSIWTKEGSPLILNTNKIAKSLSKKSGIAVEVAMRYQEPKIYDALKNLIAKGCKDITVIPLYPHYAMATTLTTIKEVKRVAKDMDLNLKFIESFFKEPAYINSLSKKIKSYLKDETDYLLFSYHGIPERHILKTDLTKSHCLNTPDCCNKESASKPFCYKAQVLETSKLCAKEIGLESDQWGVSFQSRLGPGWLKPFSDIELAELPKKGKKNIAVVCPAFVADNLETLEEMDIRGRETFLDSGGNSFTYVPCLNDDDSWIDFLSSLVD
jgi:protoporphyrin/coproporphyrin ferrochelatase